MNAGDLQYELDVAVRLARQAGDIIMQYYRAGLAVEYKAGDEPVTAADRASDDLIIAGLRDAFRDDGLLTEESDDDLSRLDTERVWIVDPLDGTAEFIAETDEFAVQIALAWQGQPVLGVICQPAKDRLFYAVRGRGAYQVCDGRATRLHVSREVEPDRMCLVASRSHYSTLVEAARQMFGIRDVIRRGSIGLKVALVAQGKCDLYLATNVAKEWDLCAPHALMLEAGGVLTNLCGEHLVYNKPEIAGCRGLIGSNGLSHKSIVDKMAPLLEQTNG